MSVFDVNQLRTKPPAEPPNGWPHKTNIEMWEEIRRSKQAGGDIEAKFLGFSIALTQWIKELESDSVD